MASSGGGGGGGGGGGRRRVVGPGGMSHLILVIFNVVTMAMGGGIAGVGVLLATRQPGTCMQELHWPLLSLGALLAAISALAILATIFKISILLRAYLLLLLLLILGLLALALFTFVVTHRSAAKALASVGYKHYRITDFSAWLHGRVNDPYRWSRIRACLRDSKMCTLHTAPGPPRFLSRILRFVVANNYDGCCKPPSVCGFSKFGTNYVTPTNSTADLDCTTYNNNEDYRCFDCTSCPTSVLHSITTNWKKIAIGVVAIATFLIIVYVIGCQAL